MIERYFDRLERDILYFRNIRSYSLYKKVYSSKQGFMSGSVIFMDESILEFSEVKDVESEYRIKYRYHYMNKDKDLIFRYDNANHFSNIATFPHHKHLEDDVMESDEPGLFDVLLEIARMESMKTYLVSVRKRSFPGRLIQTLFDNG